MTDLLAPPPQHDLSPGWGQSLSAGAAGIALLHVEHARAGLGGWDNTAHQWAAAMTREPVLAHPDACLFRGAPAVAFVLRAAGRPGYATALSTLDSHITTLTRQRLDRAHKRIERGLLPELREFDLINGLTGIGVYLLQAADTELLRDVLSHLVRLAVEPMTVDDQELPGWWTGNGPADKPSTDWPGGHANLGLAHGITGPLALLASAMTLGVTVPDHAEAIEQICAELDLWRCGTGRRSWWPGMISPAEQKARAVPPPAPAHPLRTAPPPSTAANLRRIAGRRSRHRADPAHQRRRTSNVPVGCLPAHRTAKSWDNARGRNGMTATTDTQPEDLRNRMVEHIEAAGHLHSSRVEQALRTVPRHLFVPEASVEDAYANKAITTKPGGPGGRPASCASVPTVVVMMLGQLDAQPGDHVLEIGAGTDYNAALLAELVGETGQVTTIDIHPDVTEQARRALDATGYGRVHVITGDGALGAPDQAPFDRIIVTVGPWDLPPAWLDQLALGGGCLVVPLHWRGQARSVAFVRKDGVLRARDSQLCGFIPMIGDGQDGERTGQIADDVALYWDSDQPINPTALHGVLAQPGTTVWSGASIVPNESTDLIWPRLTGTEPGTCRFAAEPAAVESGLCNPAFKYRSPAVVEGDSLAYLTLRGPEPNATERRWELGAIGHGSAGAQLAERLCEQIRVWDRDRTAQPVITAYPVSTPPDERLAAGVVIDKRFVRLVVSG